MSSETLLDPALLLLLAVVGGTIWFAVATRGGVSGTLRTVGAASFFCGALIGSLGSAHLLAVIGRAIFRRGPTFEYDFRLYSLILLGVLLITGGVRSVAAAWKLTQGDARAWKTALATTAMLLAVNLPLVPIQGFATGFSVFLGVNLLTLLATRRHFVAISGAQTLTTSGLAHEPLSSAN